MAWFAQKATIGKKSEKKGPPHTKRILRIGIIGPRNEPSSETHRAQISQVLYHVFENLKAALTEPTEGELNCDCPVLRLVTALVSNAEKLAAEIACGHEDSPGLGFDLQCPLPFIFVEAEQMSEDTSATLQNLLDRATRVFNFDYSPNSSASRAAGYRAAGETVVCQSDILIAVRGSNAEADGSVAHLVDIAIDRCVPVIEFAPSEEALTVRNDGQVTVLPRPSQPVATEALLQQFVREQMDRYFSVDMSSKSAMAHSNEYAVNNVTASVYYSERVREFTLLGGFWKLFRDVIGSPLLSWPLLFLLLPITGWTRFRVRTPQEIREDFAKSPALPSDVSRIVDDVVARHYAWADHLARYYVNLYRSVSVLCFGLAVLAVVFALAAIALGWAEADHPMHHHEVWWVIAEFVTLLVIIALVYTAERGRWHQKYLSYRLMAEQFRCFRYLACLNRPLPLAIVRRIAAERGAWVWQHYRSVVAEVGLIPGRADQERAVKCARLLKLITSDQENSARGVKKWMQGEVAYHYDVAKNLEVLDHRLHIFEWAAFVVALVACSVHLSFHAPVLVFLAAVCPAFAAAIAGLRSQGEYKSVILNSHAMVERYSRLSNYRLASSERPTADHIAHALDELAEIMLTQALDWNVIFQVRPVRLP